MSLLQRYLAKKGEKNSETIAVLAALDHIEKSCPPIAQAIARELEDQRSHVKLIASENYSSLAVQLAMGNWLNDKYAEGVPFHRFYAGCDQVDAIESYAVEKAKELFGSDHAYVQPHSGADANLVAFWAILMEKVQHREVERLGKKKLEELSPKEYESLRKVLVRQKVMGLSLASGGHLSHGYLHHISSKMMHSVPYSVDPKTGLLDYSRLAKQVKKEKPLILIAGYSSYSRKLDFSKMREIADSVGAVLLVDMAHFAGLVAGKVFQGVENPIPFAHVVTSTTHKTLRGPRGGFILCKKEFQEVVDRGCPLVLGGPLPHIMAAKAIAFSEALTPAFRTYAHEVVRNSQALAEEIRKRGGKIITGGTDNHLAVIDVEKSFHLTGRQAEKALREANLTTNRNSIPEDPNGPWHTSGIRVGTAATTTLGMEEKEMDLLAEIFVDILKNTQAPAERTSLEIRIEKKVLVKSQKKVKELLASFPLYPEIPSLKEKAFFSGISSEPFLGRK